MSNLLALVSYNVFPAEMGGQKAVVKFYEALAKQHNITLAVSHDNGDTPPGFTVEKILGPNRQMWRNLHVLFRLKKIIAQRKIECIVAEHSYTAWMAIALKAYCGIPFFIRSHNMEFSRFRQMGRKHWRLYRMAEGWMHRRADGNFFTTPEDLQTAIKQFRLKPQACSVVPYCADPYRQIHDAKSFLKKEYSISTTHLFYFNGTLDYLPNAKAVEAIVQEINPRLAAQNLSYTILISGKRLSPSMLDQIKRSSNIRYVGFVPDATVFYQAATLFLNPVINDAGVKTKVIEAIANHCTVVSTKAGAAGIPTEFAGTKLVATNDHDWDAFCEAIRRSIGVAADKTPDSFFAYFSWVNKAQKAADSIQEIISHGKQQV